VTAQRWLGPALALVATALFAVLVVRQLGRELMYDDANFALAARAVAETGLPFGNQGWMSERGDFSQREQWALWHPPLYVYLLGLFAKVGGWTPAVLRVPALLAGMATAGLTYLLARDLTRGPPPARRLAGGVAVALVMLCPLAIQSALILDIDFTLLLPLSLLFIWLYVRLEATRHQWLVLGPLFAMLLWSKMTNPLPLLAVVTAWQVLRGQPARALAHLVGIGGAGAVLFGFTWLAIGRWLGFPLDMPFSVNAVQWQDSAEVARRAYASPGAFVEGLQPTVLWLGPGLVSLGLAAIAARCGQLARCWEFRRADVLIGLLVLFVLGYVNKSAGWFPKYQIALAPPLACLGAPLIAYAWCARPRLTLVIATALALVGAVVQARLVRDDWALERTWAIDATAAAWLLGALVVGALLALPWRAVGSAAVAGLGGIGLGWMISASSLQVAAPYSTTYWYGTRGASEAAAWLDEHLTDTETYVSAKEVAIHARDQRYVDQDNLVYLFGTGRAFDGRWADEPVRAIVTWQREPYVADLLGRGVRAANYREVARFGDYVVYEAPE
jgi:4-amino-4-deoxy-L-arabinose transferase-like glycosyltransferase